MADTITILDVTSGDLHELPASTRIYPLPSEHERKGGHWDGASGVERAHLESASCGTLAGSELGDVVLLADKDQESYLEAGEDYWLTDDDGTERYTLSDARRTINLWESRVVCLGELPHSLGLLAEAREAATQGDTFRVHRQPPHKGAEWVETLIVADERRAGQSCGGDPSWGDWDEDGQIVRLDDADGEGRSLIALLDGRKLLASAYDAGLEDGLAWALDGYATHGEVERETGGWDEASIQAMGRSDFAAHLGIEDTDEAWERDGDDACAAYNLGARRGACAPQEERTGLPPGSRA